MAAYMWKACSRDFVLRNLTICARRNLFSSSSVSANEKQDSIYSIGGPQDALNIPANTEASAHNSRVLDADSLEGTTENTDTKKSFATLFRESSFVQLGNHGSKLVSGRIFDVQGDDLYISFGAKFHCVCTRPAHQPERYTRGALVKLRIGSMEMTSSFIGTENHVTLLEADCTLLSILTTSDPTKPKPQETDKTESSLDKKDKDIVYADLFKNLQN